MSLFPCNHDYRLHPFDIRQINELRTQLVKKLKQIDMEIIKVRDTRSFIKREVDLI